jgi:hypothetical protein
MVMGFLTVSVTSCDVVAEETRMINSLNVQFFDMDSFAFDTGAGEGISTSLNDFVFLDTSIKSKKSILINGPSVGTPTCLGRGPLIFTFKFGIQLMGLIHPNGIYASSEASTPTFRLASAVQMKKLGVRLVGGRFNDDDVIECVRTGLKISANDDNGILTIKTYGSAFDLEECDELLQIVEDIKKGLKSPLVDVTRFQKIEGYLAQPEKFETWNRIRNEEKCREDMKSDNLKVFLLNESKLTDVERPRLYCRRFAYCDPGLFKKMHGKEEFGSFPKLPTLNEDNVVADKAKFKRKAFKRNNPSNTMDCPPFFRVFCDGYGGQQSLGGESLEGAIGAYLFVCCSTGSTDIRLYASHKQFPIALHQFLVRVQAEHWKCRVIFVDTHSVNLSAAVEEVLALFEVQLMPVSTGTPQEMAFAESRVRVIKRMSTAMLTGAPHLNKQCWALSDRYAVVVLDYLPQQTRNYHCAYYLRTGRCVDWGLIQLKVFGAPLLYSDPSGPIHKRAPIAEKGYFVGYQWPAVLVKRERDGKIILVSRQKVRVHESIYIKPLIHENTLDEIEGEVARIQSSHSSTFDEPKESKAHDSGLVPPRPATDNNMVQSVKNLRDHKQKMMGTSEGKALDIEESAIYANVDSLHEGLYLDSVICSDTDKMVSEVQEVLNRGGTMKEALLKALRKSSKVIPNGGLSRGKNKASTGEVTRENVVESKRKRQRVEHFIRQKELGQTRINPILQRSKSGESKPSKSGELKPLKFEKVKVDSRMGKGKQVAKVGDLISVRPEIFDDKKGSYSLKNPGLVFGTVNSIAPNGIASITWVEDGSTNFCKLRDLTVVKSKRNVKSVIAGIIALLVKGKPIKKKKDSGFPKDFF